MNTNKVVRAGCATALIFVGMAVAFCWSAAWVADQLFQFEYGRVLPSVQMFVAAVHALTAVAIFFALRPLARREVPALARAAVAFPIFLVASAGLPLFFSLGALELLLLGLNWRGVDSPAKSGWFLVPLIFAFLFAAFTAAGLVSAIFWQSGLHPLWIGAWVALWAQAGLHVLFFLHPGCAVMHGGQSGAGVAHGHGGGGHGGHANPASPATHGGVHGAPAPTAPPPQYTPWNP